MKMDIDHIRSLVELMQQHDLSRIEMREGESHLLLRRGQPIITQGPAFAAQMASAAPSVSSAHISPNGGPPAATEAPAAPSAQALAIRSPVVGTFYAAAEPESPPFAKVGDVVGPDTVVCLVEAMKVFNEIKAEVSGRITKVLVKNAQAVEYDQPLFELAPA